MSDVLIFADTARSPELRHEVPLAAPDAMIYLEREGVRRIYASSLEPIAYEEIGLDELIAAGLDWHAIDRELVLRACHHAGATNVVVPRSFPLEAADHLRANGIEISGRGSFFDERRRRKSAAELTGIRRALRASEQALDNARALLCEQRSVTCEEVRTEITRTFNEAGMTIPDLVVVSHAPQTAIGHEPGHGRIERGEPVIIDLFPQLEVFERVYPEIRPGVTGRAIFDLACEVFEREGYPTQRTKEEGPVRPRALEPIAVGAPSPWRAR